MVAVVPAAGGELQVISGGLDQRCSSPAWSHHSKWVYFTAQAEGTSHIYRVNQFEPAALLAVTAGARSVTDYCLVRRQGCQQDRVI